MTQWLTGRSNTMSLRTLAFFVKRPVGSRHNFLSVVLAVLLSAGVGIHPALADPLPITIDGTGPGALTSRWLFGQSEGFFVTGANQTPGPQLRSGSTIVARDDCAHISSAVGFVDGAGNITAKFADGDNNVLRARDPRVRPGLYEQVPRYLRGAVPGHDPGRRHASSHVVPLYASGCRERPE